MRHATPYAIKNNLAFLAKSRAYVRDSGACGSGGRNAKWCHTEVLLLGDCTLYRKKRNVPKKLLPFGSASCLFDGRKTLAHVACFTLSNSERCRKAANGKNIGIAGWLMQNNL